MSGLNRTPLFDAHVRAGATMVDFGGWEMPIQYPGGIVSEHLYDRRHCGIFDVSHMGRIVVEGPERVAFLQKVLTSNVAALVPGRAQYCMIPSETGGVVDDAYLYMFEAERYLLVVNASNREKDLAYFAKFLPDYDCKLQDVTFTTASVAVQGPKARTILEKLTGSTVITDEKKNSLAKHTVQGRSVYASRTGYTGDPEGWELFVEADAACWLWDELVALGANPTGLGARDTLRLEAGLPLYGHEMGIGPDGQEMPAFAVSLARFAVSFKEEKGDFIAKDLLLAQKEQGVCKRLIPVALVDRGVIRAGMEVYQDDRLVGWITSGTMVPFYHFDENGEPTDTTGKRSIGFAYVSSDLQPGQTVYVDVRGKRLKAQLTTHHLVQNQPPYARAEII